MANCSVNNVSFLLARCDCALPLAFCVTGNVAGLISTAMWFLVLLPQVWQCARARSVQGLSPAWAIMNFTAALNNSFFVFKLGDMPIYSQVSAVYMPVLEIILLILFVLFTDYSVKKWVLVVVLVVFWTALCTVQIVFEVYTYLEWLSITMWSAETFPQIWLNSRRESTQGLNNMMVLMTTIGKSTDFIGPYVLRMPQQYVLLAYFSSSVAIFQTVQVLWYWGQVPVSEREPEEGNVLVIQEQQSSALKGVRYLGMFVLCVELAVFVVALYFRAAHWPLKVFPPIVTYGLIFGHVFVYHFCIQRNN